MRYNNEKALDMKKFFITLLILLCAAPAFCAPNWKEGANDNVRYYDDSDTQEYIQMLEDNFYKKYTVEISPTEAISTAPLNAYTKEVIIPSYEYMIKHPPKYVNN